jgi:uncharacterized membrane protein YeaQ/YmgE (transglycosylase-associated protein family)
MLWVDDQLRTSSTGCYASGSNGCAPMQLRNPDPEIDVPLPIRSADLGILWTIIIGFIAGVIAKFIMPGPNEPSGFILTAILGIVGAFVATFLGQAVGWYRAGEGAGLIGAVVGAVIVLAIWGAIARRRTSTY